MAATRADVNRWIETAKQNKWQFIISVCDTFDYEDYPVYCEDEVILKKEITKYNHVNMQKINEIIQIKDNQVIENLSPSRF